MIDSQTDRRARELGRLAACLIESRSSDRFQVEAVGSQCLRPTLVCGSPEPPLLSREFLKALREFGWVEVERIADPTPNVRRTTYRVTDWGHEALAGWSELTESDRG